MPGNSNRAPQHLAALSVATPLVMAIWLGALKEPMGRAAAVLFAATPVVGFAAAACALILTSRTDSKPGRRTAAFGLMVNMLIGGTFISNWLGHG